MRRVLLAKMGLMLLPLGFALGLNVMHMPARDGIVVSRAGLPVSRAGHPVNGLFDVFKESEEQKRIKDQQFEEMQRIQKLRRDPEAWEAEINKRRNKEAALRVAQATGQAIEVEERALPEGWGAAVDPASGETYYYDKATKETQWDFPTARARGGE